MKDPRGWGTTAWMSPLMECYTHCAPVCLQMSTIFQFETLPLALQLQFIYLDKSLIVVVLADLELRDTFFCLPNAGFEMYMTTLGYI